MSWGFCRKCYVFPHRILSIAAVKAPMIVTSGDESFVLISDIILAF